MCDLSKLFNVCDSTPPHLLNGYTDTHLLQAGVRYSELIHGVMSGPREKPNKDNLGYIYLLMCPRYDVTNNLWKGTEEHRHKD